MILVALALELLAVITSDGRAMLINPHEVVGIRPPKASDHFGPGTQCIIFTTDGKFIAARDPCEEIQKVLERSKQ